MGISIWHFMELGGLRWLILELETDNLQESKFFVALYIFPPLDMSGQLHIDSNELYMVKAYNNEYC